MDIANYYSDYRFSILEFLLVWRDEFQEIVYIYSS